VRKKLGLLRVYEIYRYDARVSGIVLPPEGFKRKGEYSRSTPIQFEISFEEPPYFRTMIKFPIQAERRYYAELKELVENQERIITTLPYLESPFAWFNKVRREIVPPETVAKFLRIATRKDLERYETESTVKVPARPELVIEATSFTPVDSFKVTEEKLKEFEAIDTFIFKTIRPGESEPYWERKGEFLHSLV
jgi:hypothetical protein